jgi:hypothetical protein
MCATMDTARVRFAEASGDVLSVVEIDAPLRAGGPDETWRTLFELETQIVSAQLRVVGDRLLQTLYLAELDGSGVDAMRGHLIKSRLETAFGRPAVTKCAPRGR